MIGLPEEHGVIELEALHEQRRADCAAVGQTASVTRSGSTLRHFFISALVRNGASIEVVRVLAGHSKLDVTQRYVHAEGSELRAAVSLLKG